jgi:hypothetical protein
MKIDEFASRLSFFGDWDESLMEIAKCGKNDISKLVKQLNQKTINH